MASSGKGRGRGWLNLNKESQSHTIRPGRPASSESLQDSEVVSTEFVATSPKKLEFVSLIEQLNVEDDGILLNQKLKNISDFIETYSSEDELKKDFEYLYETCRQDSQLSTKLVLMASSASNLKKCDIKSLKLLFIRCLQDDYENREELQTSNRVAFRNAISMLGGFFSKVRRNGCHWSVLQRPLSHYLEALLKTAELEDLETFTIQVFLNGSYLKEDHEVGPKFQELMAKVRLLLATDANLSKEGRLWLILALDIENHRFSILPAELLQFYQEHLGDSYFHIFQSYHIPLSVEITYSNKALDNIQSNVNVLQVTPPLSPKSSIWNKAKNREWPRFNAMNKLDESLSKDISSKGVGRPILGLGAQNLLHRDIDENDKGLRTSNKSNKQKSFRKGKND